MELDIEVKQRKRLFRRRTKQLDNQREQQAQIVNVINIHKP